MNLTNQTVMSNRFSQRVMIPQSTKPDNEATVIRASDEIALLNERKISWLTPDRFHFITISLRPIKFQVKTMAAMMALARM